MMYVVLGVQTYHLENKGGKNNKAEKTHNAIVIIIIITVVLIMQAASIRMMQLPVLTGSSLGTAHLAGVPKTQSGAIT